MRLNDCTTRAFKYIGYQSCRTSRQRLGVNRIDSFELCCRDCITINSVFKEMSVALSSRMPEGVRNTSFSRIAMKYQFIHSFIFTKRFKTLFKGIDGMMRYVNIYWPETSFYSIPMILIHFTTLLYNTNFGVHSEISVITR